jgi:hypothetical protein
LAVLGVPPGQPFPHVLFQALLVVIAFLEPPKPFGPGAHVLGDGLVIEPTVALDGDLAHRNALPLADLENDSNRAGRCSSLLHGDLSRVVSPIDVHRIDGGPGTLDCVAVDRPSFSEPNPVLDGPERDPVRAGHRPTLEERAFRDAKGQDQLAIHVALLDYDVVELSGSEEVPDGALDVAVIDGLPNGDAGRPDDLGIGEPGLSLDHDAIDGGACGFLGGRGSGSRAETEQRGRDEEGAHEDPTGVGREGLRCRLYRPLERQALTPPTPSLSRR